MILLYSIKYFLFLSIDKIIEVLVKCYFITVNYKFFDMLHFLQVF